MHRPLHGILVGCAPPNLQILAEPSAARADEHGQVSPGLSPVKPRHPRFGGFNRPQRPRKEARRP